MKARRLIGAKKTEIYSKFQTNFNIKSSNLFKEKLGSLHQSQYGFNNRSGAGKSMSSFQSISSRARKEVFDVHNVLKELLELRKEYEITDTERNTALKSRRVNLSLCNNHEYCVLEFQRTLFDEPLVL